MNGPPIDVISTKTQAPIHRVCYNRQSAQSHQRQPPNGRETKSKPPPQGNRRPTEPLASQTKRIGAQPRNQQRHEQQDPQTRVQLSQTPERNLPQTRSETDRHLSKPPPAPPMSQNKGRRPPTNSPRGAKLDSVEKATPPPEKAAATNRPESRRNLPHQIVNRTTALPNRLVFSNPARLPTNERRIPSPANQPRK